jgi:Fe-S-cluster-containing dehydrogenase component
MPQLEQLLQRVPFFSAVPVEALRGVVADSFQKRYRPGEKVVVQGEYGHTMFVVVRGGVRSVLTLEDGSERELSRLDQPGQFFGELSVLSSARRMLTVVAESDAVLLEIEKQRVEKLAKEHDQVLPGLEALYERRSIAIYLAQSGHFVGLSPALIDEVINRSSLRILARDDAAYEMGQPNDALYLVMNGHLKMTRPSGERVSVLAYFNAGDFFGVPDDGAARAATVTALGKSEIIRIPSELVHKLLGSPVIRERLKKVTFARKEALLKVLGGGQTVAMAAQQLMLDGQVEAASLLIIDLERCVRCGNCSASCHERHGASRLARRGKKVRRRVHGFEEGQHQHVLVPSSCYHCANPECMVGCPTGAIHREKDGEVNIYDFCIGCTNCARRCPYDNITMAARADAGVVDAAGKKKSKQIATKCDLCAGYADAACVSNCPTGAVLRVDPKVYFEEVAALRQGAIEGPQAKARATVDKVASSPRPIALGALGVAALLAVVWLAGARRPSSASGLLLGGFGFVAVLGATALAARRRLARWRLGTLQRWTQVHIALGALGFFAALLHADFALHGWLTGTLLVTFAGVFLSGCCGQIIYTRVPPLLARVEGEKSQLVEDVLNERLELEAELEGFAETEALAALARAARRPAGGLRARARGDYQPEQFAASVLEDPAIEQAIANLPPDRRADGRRVVTDVVRVADCRVSLGLYRLLRVWLALHIAGTALLLALLFAHVAAALFYFR